jgi:hypothetical protein
MVSGSLLSRPLATKRVPVALEIAPVLGPGGCMPTAAARAAYWRGRARYHCNDQIGWPVMPSGNAGLTTAMA